MKERYEGVENFSKLVSKIAEQKICFGDQEIATELARSAQLAEFSAETTLTKQDDDDRDVFLILKGKVSVSVGKKVIDHVDAGLHIGEMAALEVRRRTATITC